MHIVYITRKTKQENNLIRLIESINIKKFSLFKNINQAIQASKYLHINIIFIDLQITLEQPIDFYNLRTLQPEADICFVSKNDNPKTGQIKNCRFDFISENTNLITLKQFLTNNNGTIPYNKNVYIQTIPNFKVYLNDKEIKIRGKKTKELLALLVDQDGNPLTQSQIFRFIWPEKKEIKNNNLVRTTYNRLKKNLEEYNIDNIIQRNGNYRYMNKEHYTSDLSEILNSSKGIENYEDKYLEEYPTWNKNTKQLIRKIKYYSEKEKS